MPVTDFKIRVTFPSPFRLSRLDPSTFFHEKTIKSVIVGNDAYDWIIKNVKTEKVEYFRFSSVKLIINCWVSKDAIIGIGERGRFLASLLRYMRAMQDELNADISYIWDPWIGKTYEEFAIIA